MRKSTKRKSQLTLSAEKVREIQSARLVHHDDLAGVAGGGQKLICHGSSFGCIDSVVCGVG